VQYGDGLWGTIIINGPSTANYDIELGTLPITDWFHASLFTVNAAALHANGPPTADNMLVNGSMTSSYGGKYAETTLTPGKSHMLRIINVGINNWAHVGLDGHKFTVVAADFVPIVPYETDFLNIAVGKSQNPMIMYPTMSLQATPPPTNMHPSSVEHYTDPPRLQVNATMSSFMPTPRSATTGFA
jgi:FtsP/CotA-like multicopper oxidase with cupredoxin domain